MKRYFAFYGYKYYPGCGMEDFIGDYNTEEEALDEITKKINIENGNLDTEDEKWEYRWANIYDSKLKKEVWSKNC